MSIGTPPKDKKTERAHPTSRNSGTSSSCGSGSSGPSKSSGSRHTRTRSRSGKCGPCPICYRNFGEITVLAKHLRQSHDGKRLSSLEEAQLGLQFCSCRTYWGKGESIHRHYRPHASERSHKHRDRCMLLGLDPDSPLGSAPSLSRHCRAWQSCSTFANQPRRQWLVRSSLQRTGPCSPSLTSVPDATYVLTARVWRNLPRQFWPAWRAAVRPILSKYLTASEGERPGVLSLLLGLPAALLPPQVGGQRRRLRDLNVRLSDPVTSLAALFGNVSLDGKNGS
jgi:hypothetical protein